MISYPEARALATQLADAASGDDLAAWYAGAQALERLDGGSWLLVDQAARAFTQADSAPVSGAQGWLGAGLNEPSGFVAAVTSLHVDGRFRERAVQVLGTIPSALAAPALAMRLIDHVPQVRARAWEALRPILRCDRAEVVLDVLLAGADRQHGGDALDRVQAALLDTGSADALVAHLSTSVRRRVRRWAFVLGHDEGVVSTERLLAAAHGDSDQWIQARCAEWLMKAPDPGLVTALLDATSIEARLVALVRASESDLGDDVLEEMLVDRAPRVREQARVRARHRGWDVAALYRRRLVEPNASPRTVVACLDGLALAGNEEDLETATSRLRHASARVRAAALTTVAELATRSDAIDLLTPMLVDPGARVSAAAARQLGRLAAPAASADAAWASSQPSSRRAAWRLSHAAGGWRRVEADLRAAADPDVTLSALGRTGIRDWLRVGAATAWEPLTEVWQARLAALLTGAGLGRREQRVVAFHIGIPLPAEDVGPRPAGDLPAPAPGRRRGWLRRR